MLMEVSPPVPFHGSPFPTAVEGGHTCMKRGHRRAASVPPPIEIETSSDEDTEQVEPTSQEPETISRVESTPTCIMSETSMSQSGSEYNMSLVDIPELSHSPTHNRRSIIEWDFSDQLMPLDTINDTNMTTTFLNKFLRHSPSEESFEKEDRRSKVLNELVTTEQKYINSMRVILEIFLPSLEEIMAPEDLRYLFPFQLEHLIDLHEKLLKRLMEGISEWKGIVGDIFGRLCSDSQGEFIALYSAYMNDFKTAMETLSRYEHTSPYFCKIAKNCSQHPKCEGLSLAAFLLTPVQRIPRYELLLKQLLKHTPQDHPDSYSIEMALDSIRSNLQMLDASIQECQFTVSVGLVKNKRAVKKNHRRKRHNSSSRFGQIRRHLSHANIDDFNRNRSPEKEAYIHKPGSMRGKSVGNLAISVENLSNKVTISDTDSQATLANSRAISFSDVLLLNYEDSSDGQPQLLQENVEEEDEEADTPMEAETHSSSEAEDKDDEIKIPRSYSPSTTSDDIIIPPGANPRASFYSTNSSTSGFGSLGRDDDYRSNEGEDVGTLRHTHALDSFDSGFPEENSTVTLKPPKKEKKLFSSALKVFRRVASKDSGSKQNPPLSSNKRSNSMNHMSKYEIGQPMDFRHVQSGYGGGRSRPLSVVL